MASAQGQASSNQTVQLAFTAGVQAGEFDLP
jgi:hypothetical protein